jgi:hypothetical protein
MREGLDGNRFDRLHCRYDQSIVTAFSSLSGGTKVPNVCGFFGPNYTRRLCFGSSPRGGNFHSLLVIYGLFPAERSLVRFG